MNNNAIRKYRLKEVRESRGKTGYEVAEYLNMSPQYYYELEREDKSIKGDMLIALADWYGVPVDELINNNMPAEEPGARAFEDDWPEVVRVLRRSGKAPTEKERKRIAKIIELAIEDED